ncbi:ArpU family transcriptional regulator [Bacillus ginsengihumi]|uniref:ArpU family transcriptional regulator n=1 Tax=Heyndrickxia ginsengihumi TaxID=363870 RepID=A0A6M0P734_9BACI|nr:ArpU family phage packaging/lysis transcriptional regulator [Heyndrickxia ginsengihumi]NEY20514.1 ArpU family transcriptional regulator [Heyndrickxia ginsengihumi]
MGDQLSFFELKEIDRKRTKEKVEAKLEKFRACLLTPELNSRPKITPNYSFDIPPTFSNAFHSSTEDAAIANADYVVERSHYIKRISMAVNRLKFKERAIIIRRYMSEDEVRDWEICNELHMSERTYRRIKSSAFYNLAFALNIVVYKEQEDKDHELCPAN